MAEAKRHPEEEPQMVNSGAYGCVYSPPLRCTGQQERERGKISKFMTKEKAVNEMKAYDRLPINRLDPGERFSISNPRLCDVSKAEKAYDLLKCGHYRRGPKNVEDYKLLMYNAGGPDMSSMGMGRRGTVADMITILKN